MSSNSTSKFQNLEYLHSFVKPTLRCRFFYESDMQKRLLFLVLFSFWGLFAQAQQADSTVTAEDSAYLEEAEEAYNEDEEEIDTDTVGVEAAFDQSTITPRYPSKDRLDDYRNDRDYDYNRDAPPPDNPFAKFWYWIQRKILSFLESKSYENFWQYVILAAIAALALWLLYKSDFLGMMLGKRAQEAPLGYDVLSENIHELDFNELIDTAIQQRNFRLAVRLFYLKTLKQLTDQRLINWQPTKTNRTYVHELQSPALRRDFEQLTRQFEYVWYGDFALTDETFQALKADFQKFGSNLPV